jgi:hypothetical protein
MSNATYYRLDDGCDEFLFRIVGGSPVEIFNNGWSEYKGDPYRWPGMQEISSEEAGKMMQENSDSWKSRKVA